MTSPEVTPIAVAVVEHAGKVLVGQRRAQGPLAGYWEFPGGKVQPGESPRAAAARECLEETGLAVVVGRPWPDVEYEYPHGRVRISFFSAEPADPERPARDPFRWVALADLETYRFPPANADMIQTLLARGREAKSQEQRPKT